MVIFVAKSHLSGLLHRYLLMIDGWKDTWVKKIGSRVYSRD